MTESNPMVIIAHENEEETDYVRLSVFTDHYQAFGWYVIG